ncbi:hypothetical protein E1A91_D13G196000v1 [Gossypium mustelinum]|uniref:SHSP domain-containing protein n=4 Tax=Gossypium TaxID=3633 RepID=A0A5J5NNN3_GOSBA|nr:hypothetical protein ES319_D13G191800v1 [Gossypium barbadense]TYG38216.1 hypothetical protein ES288_D13G203600v1 [Gossypium darwinii]TYH35614.1 hypothetical protein ES332_D13G204800v1 [Gossypium tomentosum]TYI47750.1 hypothetical protein E1A91_D13G196000v1 [Gossypium mustelinum]PPD86721.1 hypothetical protein GOBAR_DD16336 [Gossypium barbadense]
MEITYEEFEPFCKWKREPNCDTLEIHLPGFKRQQLRVQLSSSGNLVISGERESDSDGKKGSRFRREFKVSNEIEANQIRAQFCSGILYVIMPKRSTAAAAGVDVKASTMNWSKRLAMEIIVAVSSAVAVGVYVTKYCQCSHLGS